MAVERLEVEGPEANYHAYHAAQHLVRYATVREVVQGKRVLDVACGAGYGACLLAKWGAREVVGIDIAPKAIASAQRLFQNKNVRFLVGDAENLTEVLGDAPPFDIVMSLETIEHLDAPDRLLGGIKKYRREDGIVVISCPNDAACHSEPDANRFHVQRWSFEEFRDLTEGHLGAARKWLLGAPVQGKINLEIGNRSSEGEHTDAISLLDVVDLSHSVLIPSQANLRTSEQTCSHYIGVWGECLEENVVVAAMSVQGYLGPWREIMRLSAEQNEVQSNLKAIEEARDFHAGESKKWQAAHEALVMSDKEELERQLGQRSAEKAQLQLHIDSISTSTSWRLTKPLRAVVTRFPKQSQLARRALRWGYRKIVAAPTSAE